MGDNILIRDKTTRLCEVKRPRLVCQKLMFLQLQVHKKKTETVLYTPHIRLVESDNLLNLIRPVFVSFLWVLRFSPTAQTLAHQGIMWLRHSQLDEYKCEFKWLFVSMCGLVKCPGCIAPNPPPHPPSQQRIRRQIGGWMNELHKYFDYLCISFSFICLLYLRLYLNCQKMFFSHHVTNILNKLPWRNQSSLVQFQ